MAINCSFVDSAVYGTDDINKITNSLVGAGVSPFPTRDVYNVSDLNILTEAVADSGVQLGGCLCSVTKNSPTTLKITVSKGMVFFDSGVRLDVDDDGFDIFAEVNKSGYVFANYNPSLQSGNILFEEEVDTVGESVVLAYIDEVGNIIDMRKIAESKIASFGKNIMKKCSFQRMTEVVPCGDGYVVAMIPGVDVTRFNFAVLVATDSWHDDNLIFFPNIGYKMAFYDIANKKNCFSLWPDGENLQVKETNFFYKSVSGFLYYPEIVGGELCIVCNCREDEALQVVRDALGCTACLM